MFNWLCTLALFIISIWLFSQPVDPMVPLTAFACFIGSALATLITYGY